MIIAPATPILIIIISHAQNGLACLDMIHVYHRLLSCPYVYIYQQDGLVVTKPARTDGW